MSEAELAALEREVEAARQKVAADLARLRSPANMSDFKTDLAAEARAYGDEYMQKAKQSAASFAQQALAELKEKAIANPAAAAAIGAGVAWRLFRSPPIATLLIGGGLVSLLRTGTGNGHPGPYDDDHPTGYVPGGVAGYGYEPDEGAAANRARWMSETAQTMQYRAEDLATSTREGAAALADSVKDRAAHLASSVKEQASGLAGSMRDQAASLVGSAKHQAASLAGSAKEQAASLAGSAKEQAASAAALTKDRAAGLTTTMTQRATELAGAMRQTADEWVGDARATARDTAGRLADATDAASSSMSSLADEVMERGSRTARDLSRRAQDALPAIQANRDTYLMGAAALAIGAAIGVAMHRRATTLDANVDADFR